MNTNQINPNNWRMGIFYHNKMDKRIIVPKHNPALGWTLNFAHPLSYVVLILFLAMIVALLLVIPTN